MHLYVCMNAYVYIYEYVYCYVSSLLSRWYSWYSWYFGIFACPGHTGEEVRKWIKIHNLSYLPKLACKGHFTTNNNDNKGIDSSLRNYCMETMYQND